MTISVNDDSLRLLVLPPIDSDVADKITLFKINRCEMPMPTNTQEEKDRFWAQLINELPAFIHFLQGWEIPEQLRVSRGGIRHYHHPDILAVLDEFSPEARLLSLIDMHFFENGRSETGVDHIEMTSTEIERQLLSDNGEIARIASKLFSFNNACGRFLANLTQQQPGRVTSRILHGSRRYKVQAPHCLPQEPNRGGGVNGLITLSPGRNESNHGSSSTNPINSSTPSPQSLMQAMAQPEEAHAE